MSARKKTLAWVLGLAALAVLAFLAGRYFPLSVPDDSARAPADAETPADAALPPTWDFEWRDGDVRGIDVPSHVRVGNQRVPMRHLADLTGEPGEEKIDFLLRVRAHLVDFSHTSRREGCGEICQAPDGRFSVRLTTNDAAVFCAVAPICPEGHASLRESIHSHCPRRSGIKASLSDEILSGGQIRRRHAITSCDTDAFSQLDFRGRRPGWLAGRMGLYKHEGPEQVAQYGEPISGPALGTAP